MPLLNASRPLAHACFVLLATVLWSAGARGEAPDPLEPIRERVRAEDSAAALQLIEQLPERVAERADVRYLAARLQAEQGRYRDALATLPRATSELPPRVVRDVGERRARLLARTGRCADARLMLTTLAARDARDGELTLLAAECALNQGDPASALALLQGLRGASSRRFPVRLLLAKVLALTGDRAGAAKELRALYVELPQHSRNGVVEELLREVDPDFRVSADERLDRAESWLAAHQHDRALAEIEAIDPPKSDKRLRARLLHVHGMVLFRTRTQYAEAAELLARAAALGGTAHAEDAFLAAKALARADKDPAAVRAFRRFARKNPHHRRATDALHSAAWLELRHDMPGAERNMRAFLRQAERRKDRARATSATWELAFFLYSKKRCAKAIPLFEEYAETSPVAMVRARGLYWAGRCALQAKKRGLAIKHLKAALEVEPLHYYALLARSRLVSIGEDAGLPFGLAPGQATTAEEAASGVRPVPWPDDVAFYMRLGLMSDALDAMRDQESAVRGGLSPESVVAMAAAYRALGEYTRAYLLAERARGHDLSVPPVGVARAVWDSLFPRPYDEPVMAAAAKYGLEPELVYAVMRKESAYNPSVVSSADAIGLMQLLEGTARSMAEDLQWPVFERKMLYDPAVNVALGTHYIAKLLERYSGQAPPAIAAYNAGEHRVDPWLKRGAQRGRTVELDRFVEDIPIDQTRNYVRRVIGNWARYRYLAHPGQWPIDLPLTLTVKGGKKR